MRGLNQEMVSSDAPWVACGQRESALIPAEVSAYTPRSTRQNQPYILCSSILGASGTIVLTSDVRRGPFESEAAQASACWRYAVMIGVFELPPKAGSPRRPRDS